MSDLGVPELDSVLQQTLDALRSVRARHGPGGAGRSSGKASGGLVRATAAAGRLESLSLAPDAMRMTAAELADAVTTAVNQALDGQGTAEAWAAYGGETAGLEGVDASVLAAQVAEIQEQGIRQMRQIGQAIADVMAQMRKQG